MNLQIGRKLMVNMLNHNILLPDWKETMEYLENVFNQATFFRVTRDISAFILPDIGFRFPVGLQLKKNKIESPAMPGGRPQMTDKPLSRTVKFACPVSGCSSEPKTKSNVLFNLKIQL